MLVLSMHDELIYAERLLAAGASGYIMKQAAVRPAARRPAPGARRASGISSESLAENLERPRGGSADAGAKGDDPIERLSNRELQVLSLIGRGQSSREAADRLGLSVKTVETHRQSLEAQAQPRDQRPTPSIRDQLVRDAQQTAVSLRHAGLNADRDAGL